MKVAVVGGGLAGTACADVLKKAGIDVTLYEAGKMLASGASGNDVGLYNPRLSAHRSPESDFYVGAFAHAIRTFSTLNDIDWNQCGALHLMVDEKKQKRFPQTYENWGWPDDLLRIVTAEEASDIAGLKIEQEALFMPGAGHVSPRKLCHEYAKNIDLTLNANVQNLSDLTEDIIILACGFGVTKFKETSWLPLQRVRGQITEITATPQSKKLRANLCYGGYVTLAHGDTHTLGATFQRWVTHDDIVDQDDEDNLQGLKEIIPGVMEGTKITGHRAAVRTTSKDHFPVIGRVPGHDNLYVSTGHGSHGVISSIAGAHLLADMILGRPLSQSKSTTACLNPSRFCDTPEA